MQKPIYFDYNATTPTDPRVVQAMLPYFTEIFGNSANTLNEYGQLAEDSIQKSTHTIATILNCKDSEIIWNSGANEGNNSVVFSIVKKYKTERPQDPIHLITSQIEHSSVLNSFKELEKDPQIKITYLPVDKEGFIKAQDLKNTITPHTRLVSLIWVNNEIGTINPIPQLAKICKDHQVAFHTDATQAISKLPIDLQSTPIDFLTFSAHKFYGPKGVGVLYQRSPSLLDGYSYFYGGGHQNKRRSGTLNTPGIVGTSKALSLCYTDLDEENHRLQALTQTLFDRLKQAIPELKLNGPAVGKNRSPINLSLTFPLPIEMKTSELKTLAFSQGSACKSGKTTSSHVLKAIGLNEFQSSCTTRLSIGRWTTEQDVNIAISTLSKAFHAPEVMV